MLEVMYIISWVIAILMLIPLVYSSHCAWRFANGYYQKSDWGAEYHWVKHPDGMTDDIYMDALDAVSISVKLFLAILALVFLGPFAIALALALVLLWLLREAFRTIRKVLNYGK